MGFLLNCRPFFTFFNDAGNNQNNSRNGTAKQKQPLHVAVNCTEIPDEWTEHRQWQIDSKPTVDEAVCKKAENTDNHCAYSGFE